MTINVEKRKQKTVYVNIWNYYSMTMWSHVVLMIVCIRKLIVNDNTMKVYEMTIEMKEENYYEENEWPVI